MKDVWMKLTDEPSQSESRRSSANFKEVHS